MVRPASLAIRIEEMLVSLTCESSAICWDGLGFQALAFRGSSWILGIKWVWILFLSPFKPQLRDEGHCD